MASTHDATQAVPAPPHGLRRLFRATVAVTAALVVGVAIGNVIDSGRAGLESVAPPSARVVETDEGLSELSIGTRQITGSFAGDPRWIGASEELVGSLQADGLTAAQQATVDRLDGLAGFHNPAASSIDSLLGNPTLPEAFRAHLAAQIAQARANAAATARYSGPAELYAQPITFSPELIWAVRAGSDAKTEIWDRGGFTRPYDAPGSEPLVPQVVAQPAQPGPVTNRPFGMQ